MPHVSDVIKFAGVDLYDHVAGDDAEEVYSVMSGWIHDFMIHTDLKVVFGWTLFTFNPFRVVDQWVMKFLFKLNPFGIPKTIFSLV